MNGLKTTFWLGICLTTLLLAGITGAVTLDVPGSYTTIQAAMGVAVTNDVILVADGTYAENITIPVGVTLRSINGAATTTIAASGGAAITVAADGVEINGFTITNPTGTQAIYANDHSNLWIRNNNITNVGDGVAAAGVQSIAVVCTAVDVDNVVIEDNHFSYIYGGPNVSMSAMSIGWSSGDFLITGLVIQNNIIEHLLANTDLWSVGHGAYGILINHGTGTTGMTIGAQILNNTIDDVEGLWAHGIGLEGNTPGAVVTGNTISNLVDHKSPTDAVAVQVEDNAARGTITITGNSFSSPVGVSNVAGSIVVNAAGNYWGDLSGPFNATTNPTGLGSAVQDFVDYSPWYGLTLGTSPMTIGTNDDIQDAINLALGGDTVNAIAPTFVAPGQIVIDKDLTINGAGKTLTTIQPGFNTSTASYVQANALVYVDYGVTATIENLTIDGTGFTVFDGIQSRGAHLTVSNCDVRNIFSSTYLGFGIAFLTGTGLVENCELSGIQRVGVQIRGAIEPVAPVVTIDGLTYTGKGDGDFLDYGVEFGGGGIGTITNSSFSACTGVAATDGSTSAGIYATTYFGPGTTATITNTALTGNYEGLTVGYATDDVSVVSIHNSIITGNTHEGIEAMGVEVDAENNWWGDASGPLDISDDTATGGLYNPSGLGDAVSDKVDYDPWSGPGAFTVTPPTSGPFMCGEEHTLTVNLTTDAYTTDVFGFNAVVRATHVTWGTITSLSPFGTSTQFFSFDNGDGSYTISGTTVGSPSQPITGTGTTGLFTIVFTTDSEGTADITFDSFSLRDPSNAPIAANATGATIDIDCTAPVAVTGITATPHHNKVEVSWVHTGLDVNHYEVFSGLWHNGTVGTSAYPEYDDVQTYVPARPGSHAGAVSASEWVGPFTATGLIYAQTWLDASNRGVYSYEVFAVDTAGNISAPAPANDRATNYWLGDIDADGVVNAIGDITPLGAAFGTTSASGTPPYNNFCDVGPTDDWSRVGIPTTDNRIDFEDLMVFSMNFGVVSSSNKDRAPLSGSVDLAWVSYENGTMALRLVNGNGLKGLRLTAAYPVNNVTAGQLLDDQSELTFLKNVGSNLDASVAVMGVNNGFSGQGDLMVIAADSPIAISDLKITARGTDNSTMTVNLDKASDTATPRVFSLNTNYPNPFNPMTKISYSLPEAQNVKLMIYSVDGKRVATLVNGQQTSGLHEVVWMGRDDHGKSVATGTYFYQIKAGPYSQVKKMTLIK